MYHIKHDDIPSKYLDGAISQKYYVSNIGTFYVVTLECSANGKVKDICCSSIPTWHGTRQLLVVCSIYRTFCKDLFAVDTVQAMCITFQSKNWANYAIFLSLSYGTPLKLSHVCNDDK